MAHSQPEIIQAIETGLDYWSNWFLNRGPVNLDDPYKEPRKLIATRLTEWRQVPEIIDTVIEGTRELAFDIVDKTDDSGEHYISAFGAVFHRLLHDPDAFVGRVYGHQEQYPLGAATLKMAYIGAMLNKSNWHS